MSLCTVPIVHKWRDKTIISGPRETRSGYFLPMRLYYGIATPIAVDGTVHSGNKNVDRSK